VEAALELLRWFGDIFERYDLPENFRGTFNYADQDYFKFLGHELYVTFIGFFIRERRWDMLERILVEPISVRYIPRYDGPSSVDWKFASAHLRSFINESPRRQRVSLHADILKERHTTGGLAAIMPFEDFMAADYFLFLLGEMPPENAPASFFEWRPWSALYLKRAPAFLRSAEHKQIAAQIMKALHIESAEEFRKRLAARAPRLAKLFTNDLFWEGPLRTEDVERFGTR
jgi:hypothetical protein